MITIELKDDQVSAALVRLSGSLADMTPVMGSIVGILGDNAEERFDAQVSPEGTPWAPRSPVTLERYLTKGIPFMGILRQSGHLRNESIGTDFGPDFAEVSSSAPYSAMMQFGGTRAAFPHLWGDIPARPFLGLSEKDRTDILALLGTWLEDAAEPG